MDILDGYNSIAHPSIPFHYPAFSQDAHTHQIKGVFLYWLRWSEIEAFCLQRLKSNTSMCLDCLPVKKLSGMRMCG